MSASAQYYTFNASIKDIALRLSTQLCGTSDGTCQTLVTDLAAAAYLDIDYDTISRAVVVNAGWPSGRGGQAWTETISRSRKDGPVEIGVLTHEPNPDPEDVQFGGFLTVLGQDASPSKPIFPESPH